MNENDDNKYLQLDIIEAKSLIIIIYLNNIKLNIKLS